MKLRSHHRLSAFWFASVFLSFAIAVSWGSSAVAQAKSSAKEIPAQQIAAPKDVSDQAIQTRLRQIFKTSGWLPDLTVEVKEGLVFLSGKIKRSEKKEWAIQIIQKTEGVVGIVDNLDDGRTADVISPVQQEIGSIVERAERATPYIVVAIVLLLLFGFLAYAFSRFTRRVMDSRENSNALLSSAVSNLVGLVVVVLGLYFALRASGLSTLAVTLLGGTGFIGIGIGLALKSTFENYSASLMITLRELFKKGEWVKIGDSEGIVHSVTTRGTTLMDFEGTIITIPNATVFNSTIRNLTRNPNMRVDFSFGISTTESIDKTKEIVLKTLGEIDGILKDPEVLFAVTELESTTVRIKVFFWINGTTHSRVKVRSLAVQSCLEAMREANLSLESESREISFTTPLNFVEMTEYEAGKKLEKSERGGLANSSARLEAADTKSEIVELKEQAAATKVEKGDDLLEK